MSVLVATTTAATTRAVRLALHRGAEAGHSGSGRLVVDKIAFSLLSGEFGHKAAGRGKAPRDTRRSGRGPSQNFRDLIRSQDAEEATARGGRPCRQPQADACAYGQRGPAVAHRNDDDVGPVQNRERDGFVPAFRRGVAGFGEYLDQAAAPNQSRAPVRRCAVQGR